MKVLNNKDMDFINGYLEALCDIDGKQKEFFITGRFLASDGKQDHLSDLVAAFDFLESPKIINKETYSNFYSINSILEKLLLIQPFGNHAISDKVLSEYRRYVICHLVDFIDFAFEKEGFEWEDEKKLELIQFKDNKNCIALIISIENIKLVILFFRDLYSDSEFHAWFDEVIQWEKHKSSEKEMQIFSNEDSNKTNSANVELVKHANEASKVIVRSSDLPFSQKEATDEKNGDTRLL